jgi:hypothetical protein
VINQAASCCSGSGWPHLGQRGESPRRLVSHPSSRARRGSASRLYGRVPGRSQGIATRSPSFSRASVPRVGSIGALDADRCVRCAPHIGHGCEFGLLVRCGPGKTPVQNTMVSRKTTKITITIAANMNGGRFMVPISKSAHAAWQLACHIMGDVGPHQSGAEKVVHAAVGEDSRA